MVPVTLRRKAIVFNAAASATHSFTLMEISLSMVLLQHASAFNWVLGEERISSCRNDTSNLVVGSRRENHPSAYTDWAEHPVCVWFESLSLSHTEHDLQIILQSNTSKNKQISFPFVKQL